MKHYTAEELEMYRHKAMSVLSRIQCSAHLQSCPDCRKILEELKADDDFITELRKSLASYKELAEFPVKK